MSEIVISPQEYGKWLVALKQRIQSAQQRAILSVNSELVLLYWHIGRDILERQQAQGWGAKVIDQLAKDLTATFPDMKGFSRRNPSAWPSTSCNCRMTWRVTFPASSRSRQSCRTKPAQAIKRL